MPANENSGFGKKLNLRETGIAVPSLYA